MQVLVKTTASIIAFKDARFINEFEFLFSNVYD